MAVCIRTKELLLVPIGVGVGGIYECPTVVAGKRLNDIAVIAWVSNISNNTHAISVDTMNSKSATAPYNMTTDKTQHASRVPMRRDLDSRPL